ncbi:MAG: AmmeMemoRadiSam system protein B [Candidatus Omnitrophota bacterium]
MVRRAAMAGQFYTADKKELREELESMLPPHKDKINAIGAVVPHAGYIYSGKVAGEVYSRIKPKQTYVILSPNHTGYGRQFAASEEPWQTPFGTVEIDEVLLSIIKEKTSLIKDDSEAHLYEHSIEVQLPFIQMIAEGAKIVPITVQYGKIEELEQIAEALFLAVKETQRDVTILASSDMTHYEDRVSAEEKDKMAIERVLALDSKGLLRIVEEKNISMCGYIPVAIMLMTAKKMKAEKAELVKYSDSGYITGDMLQVVGYAGVVVY